MIHASIHSLWRALNALMAIDSRLSARKLLGAAANVSGHLDEEEGFDAKERQANLCSESRFRRGKYLLVVTLDVWVTHGRGSETADEACESEVRVELRHVVDDTDDGVNIGLVRYWPDTDTWFARPPTAREEPIGAASGMIIEAREPSNIDRDGALATIDDLARRVSSDVVSMAS